jgi:hypothetical protein
MTKSKSSLIDINIEVCTLDMNRGRISISEVQNSEDFFESIREIISQYSGSVESYVLDWDPDFDSLDGLEYEVKDAGSEGYDPNSDEIEFFQAHISKKGNISFQINPSRGKVIIETVDVNGYMTLSKIIQDGEDIEYEIEDFGRPNEELLGYIAHYKNGLIDRDIEDGYFSIDPEEDRDEDVDERLREITYRWFEDIFQK